MPRVDHNLASTAFWDVVEQRLAACSIEELRAIVRALAQATPPAAQPAFLDVLRPAVPAAAGMQPAFTPDALLADITALVDALRAATEAANDWDEYDEEEGLGPYEEFVEPLTALFDRVAAVCETGNALLVRTAYQHLFEALGLEDDYGRGVRAAHLYAVPMHTARAHYLRAVYDTEAPARRPAVLCAAMLQAHAWLSGARPMLDDIIQIVPQPLPDREQFGHDWIDFLRTQSGPHADAWLREAVRLWQGTRGLETLARTEGRQRPRVYLDWCAALMAEGRPDAVRAAAEEALQILPAQLPIRAAMADYLCAAATLLHDTDALRVGRWQAFAATPTLERLLDVWESAPAGPERAGLMRQAADHVQWALAHPPGEAIPGWEDALERPVWPVKSVLAHAYLLAGDWDAAHQLAVPEQVLGWSSSLNPQGLIVSFFLVQMSGMSPEQLSSNLMQQWHWELQNSTGFGSWHSADAGEASLLTRLQRVYMEYLPAVTVPRETQVALLAWCQDVVQRRVNAIVGNQHRGSYDKAALLLAACAELLHRLGRAQEATLLLDDARRRFSRHRAFQTELQAVVRRLEA